MGAPVRIIGQIARTMAFPVREVGATEQDGY